MCFLYLLDRSKEKELRRNIEAQVAHEKRAYKNVEKTVLSDAVGRDMLQDVVCIKF